MDKWGALSTLKKAECSHKYLVMTQFEKYVAYGPLLISNLFMCSWYAQYLELPLITMLHTYIAKEAMHQLYKCKHAGTLALAMYLHKLWLSLQKPV